MNLKFFSIRDSKVDAFMRPFIAQTTKEAMRIFEDSVNRPDSGFFKHPDDYSLFELGDFNPLDGSIIPHVQVKNLGLASEFIKADNQENLPFKQ